jgi:hypothetical protein
MSKTISGKYCAPKVGTGKCTCYTRKQLVDLAKKYNIMYSDKINISLDKKTLWSEINKRMDRYCTSEWCWSDKLKYQEGYSSFRPLGPTNKKKYIEAGEDPWLSTSNIRNVLQQYQELYHDFMSVGPVPIDFCYLGHVICDLDISLAYRNGTRTIGIVFNTDPSTKSGKHWICMFIDMRPRDPRLWEINYYDSYGMGPLPPEINDLVLHISKEIKKFTSKYHKIPIKKVKVIKKMNCKNDVCNYQIMNQKSGTDCGVYCIHFIVQRLKGKTWEQIVTRNSQYLNDRLMSKLRAYYFRPRL